jgi:hypothetical protein
MKKRRIKQTRKGNSKEGLHAGKIVRRLENGAGHDPVAAIKKHTIGVQESKHERLTTQANSMGGEVEMVKQKKKKMLKRC